MRARELGTKNVGRDGGGGAMVFGVCGEIAIGNESLDRDKSVCGGEELLFLIGNGMNARVRTSSEGK